MPAERDYGADFDRLIADAAADGADRVLYVSGDGLMVNFTARATYLSPSEVYRAEVSSLGPGEAVQLAEEVRARAEATGAFEAVYTGMATRAEGRDIRLHGSLVLELSPRMVDEYFDDVARHGTSSKDLYLDVQREGQADMVTAVVDDARTAYVLGGLVDARRTDEIVRDLGSRGFTVREGLPPGFGAG